MNSTLATLADNVSALCGLFWVVLAGVVLFFLLPELRKVLQSRDFSIEVAGMTLSAQKASDELARQIEDLQTQVATMQIELEDRRAGLPVPGLKEATTAGSWPTEGDSSPAGEVPGLDDAATADSAGAWTANALVDYWRRRVERPSVLCR